MNLLLIMPKFFDYPQIIQQELEKMGYHVDFFDDRPSTNNWVKAIIRVNKNFINGYIKKYFRQIMNTIHGKEYDVVLLISGQSLSFSEGMIKQLRDSLPKARFILYQWDALKNFPYINLHIFSFPLNHSLKVFSKLPFADSAIHEESTPRLFADFHLLILMLYFPSCHLLPKYVE